MSVVEQQARGAETSSLALRGKQLHGFPVEGNEGFPAEPAPLVCDHSIGEVAARIKYI